MKLSYFFLLSILLAMLKAAEVIHWSWWIILFPAFVGFGCIGFCLWLIYASLDKFNFRVI